MTRAQRASAFTRRLTSVFAGAALLTTIVAAHSPVRTGQRADAGAAAIQQLQGRLQQYLQLRAELAMRLKPLAPTASAAELAARQAELADAIRKARASARPGDLIPPAAAAHITQVIIDDFMRRSAAEERATFSEVPNAPRPTVNRTYPADAALATVPPLLLLSLPRLPDNLQYRFYGRHLVVLDGDVQIIVDYIADVLPPH